MAIVESSNPTDGEKSKSLRLHDDEEDNNGEEDRLSSLPDVLLVEILSLLPIQSAASTSVLSRRWRHLWTHVTRLRFSCADSLTWQSFDGDHEIHKICPIINHIFRQLSSSLEIRSFHLDSPKLRCSCVQSWIRQICRRNVEEIEVCVHTYHRRLFSLPTCVFETQSLVVLKLSGCFTYKLPHNGIISLPNLKKLWLDIHDPDLELTRLLFKLCPLLEDLYLQVYCEEDDHFVDISAQNLKRLVILGAFVGGYQFRIDTPQLEYLKIVNHPLSSYCFIGDLSGLLEAEISVGENRNNYILGDVDGYLAKMAEFFRWISSVRSLCLSSITFKCLYYLHDEDIVLPLFHNLIHLDISLFNPAGWTGLLRFLRRFPNLEVLVVSQGEVDCECMKWTVPDSVPVLFVK